MAKKFIYGPGIDEPIMMQPGETKYYYHADRLGSIIALADSTGNLVDTYRYSVYGEVDNPGSLGNPFLYTGREYDSETGLYYYRARYYDAGLRRFLQPDPIGYLGGMNLYAYVGNDPINWVDPWGLEGFNINLLEHEFAGGHTIKLHVAKGIPFLRNRVQKKEGPNTASSFYSLRHAQALINMVLNENRSTIEEMMCLPDKGWATIQSTFDKPTGYTILNGRRKSHEVYNVFIYIRKPATTKEGFVVVTSYPE